MIVNNPFEKEIKAAVINKLLKNNKITQDTIIINELVIDSFSRRADLVIIKNNTMTAFEIKSEADNLNRLAGQVEKYLSYFDKVIVVSTAKHLDKITSTVPKKIGLWQYNTNGDLLVKNRGITQKINEKNNYLDLLKINEMKKLAKKLDINLIAKNKGKIKTELSGKLKIVPFQTIKSFVIETLQAKYKMPSDYFIKKVLLKKNVNKNDIDLLSLYGRKKLMAENLIATQKMVTKEDLLLEKLAKESLTPIFGVAPNEIKKLFD